MNVVGIAGGSGSGKSTVCYTLIDKYPETFEVINIDDYQKLKTDPNLPMVGSMINWDHPDIIDWDNLIRDIQKLKSGKKVTINTWSHRSNLDYHTHGKMIPRTIYPKEIILVEGYLTLYNPSIRKLFDSSFYFDLDEATRNSRRDKANLTGKYNYEEKVLMPMHKKYVEPTKVYADNVVTFQICL